MDIENLSAENKLKLVIAEMIVINKQKGDFETMLKRLDMLCLK